MARLGPAAILSGIRAKFAQMRLFSLRDMIWQYVANFGVSLFGALFLLVMGRLLGPREFGIYALAAATPAVVNAIFDYRLQEVTIVLLSEDQPADVHSRNIKILYLLDIAARTVSLLLSALSGYFVLGALGFPIGYGIPAFAALSVFFAKAGNSTALGVLRTSGNIQTYAILQSLDWATRLLSMIVAFGAGFSSVSTAFVIQIAPAIFFNVLTVVISTRVARRKLGCDFGLAVRWRDVRAFVRVRRKLLLSSQMISAVDSVVKEMDTLICGIFLVPQSVAVYKMAKSITAIAWKFVDPIFVLILPSISNYIASGRIAELSGILRKATRTLFLVALLIYVASAVTAFPFTYLALGESYRQVPMVYPLVACWIVFALPFIWTHSVAIASGNAPLQALAGAIGNLAGVVAITVGAASGGVYGAAIGLSVAYAAPFLISAFLLIRKNIIQW